MRELGDQLFRPMDIIRAGAFAGLVGGSAEIVWVALYGSATGTPTAPVAQGVTQALIPSVAASPWSAGLGVLFHLTLAIALGVALATVLWFPARRLGFGHSEFPIATVALAAVWAINFLVALPQIEPAFVHLLPYGVTLLSKLLFGWTAAAVMRADRLRRVGTTAG
jgi:hypothetical protein